MLPPLFTWMSLPDLPSPPQYFITKALDIADQSCYTDTLPVRYQNHDQYRRRQIKYNGQHYVSRCQESVSMGREFEEWVRDNVFPCYLDASLRINKADNHTQVVQGAHVDGRMLKLIWVIEQGGDSAVTEFYKAPDHAVVNDVLEGQRLAWIDMDELTIIDRGQFPLDSWSIHNGFVFHGMNGLTDRRLEFSVSIRPQDFFFSLQPNLP